MQVKTPERIREDMDARNEAYRRQMESQNRMPNPGYTMNNTIWPGLAKVMEEAGEVVQVGGKIMATFGRDKYYDGEDLRRHLEEEVADSLASMRYLIAENKLDQDFIDRRIEKKLKKYYQWKSSNE